MNAILALIMKKNKSKGIFNSAIVIMFGNTIGRAVGGFLFNLRPLFENDSGLVDFFALFTAGIAFVNIFVVLANKEKLDALS